VIDVSVKKTLGTFTLNARLQDEGFVCLSGKNGSGKSTLLRLIAGKLRPDEGFVKVNSVEVTSHPMEKRGVVLVTPDSYIPHFPVEKHLRWGASARGIRLAKDSVSATRAALGITYEGRMDKLSLGMRERVSLATAVLSHPSILLVDEAFAALDDKESLMSALRGLCSKQGVDVLFTTQEETDGNGADHHYLLQKGTSTRLK